MHHNDDNGSFNSHFFSLHAGRILEKEKSSSPSNEPSISPSVSNIPSTIPSNVPSTLWPTDKPSSFFVFVPDPDIEYGSGSGGLPPPTGGAMGHYGEEDEPEQYFPTASPNEPLHSQNEYDTAPDFSDWDDFFESKSLHNLNEIMEDYSVAISYSGSRFYGTIIRPDAKLDDIFHPDYHAFWSQSFDMNRTFIISDTTAESSPVGVDFYEMRRRTASSMQDSNVQFSYGPYGALIPLMDYQGTGFFHCLHETDAPSTSPSSSRGPTTTPSSCFLVEISIMFDEHPDQISWTLIQFASADEEPFDEAIPIESSSYDSQPPRSSANQTICLPEGLYEFLISDSKGNGLSYGGYRGNYSLRYDGITIASGEGSFQYKESTKFTIPLG